MASYKASVYMAISEDGWFRGNNCLIVFLLSFSLGTSIWKMLFGLEMKMAGCWPK